MLKDATKLSHCGYRIVISIAFEVQAIFASFRHREEGSALKTSKIFQKALLWE